MLTPLDASRGMEITLLPSKVEGVSANTVRCITRNGGYFAPV